MSPSEQDILRLWELYNEAEAFITEISTSWDGLDTTAVNQLRYAGRHLLNSLTGKTPITPEKEYERAVAHVKRATFDAIDSGIIYYLHKIDLFKDDYRNIEITTAGYPDIIASARKAKHLLDEARSNSDNRHEYYQEAKRHFKLLKESCETLEDARPEQNKRLRAYNQQIRVAYMSIFGTVISIILAALTLFFSL